MESATASADTEVCARCMQPVPQNALKCPHCSMPRTRTRRYTITLGIIGLAALIFVIVIMVKAIQDSDIQSAPPDSPDAEQSAPSAPAQPDKPPPLNQ
jgi:predicted nucleic acid-binding Zn ribbon protein